MVRRVRRVGGLKSSKVLEFKGSRVQEAKGSRVRRVKREK